MHTITIVDTSKVFAIMATSSEIKYPQLG